MAMILMASIKCKKDVIPTGQLIQANGYVMDNFKNKHLPNVKIYLYGGIETYGNITYSGPPLDSAMSDANGNFSISYHTEGTSVDYALIIGNYLHVGYPMQYDYVTDISQPAYAFNGVSNLNNIVLKARELNYVRLNLKVLSNPYDTLDINVTSTIGAYGNYFILHRLTGSHIDTSLYTRYLPGTYLTSFGYFVENHFLSDSLTGFMRSIYDTLPSNSKDTVIYSKTFNSTYDIPIRHS